MGIPISHSVTLGYCLTSTEGLMNNNQRVNVNRPVARINAPQNRTPDRLGAMRPQQPQRQINVNVRQASKRVSTGPSGLGTVDFSKPNGIGDAYAKAAAQGNKTAFSCIEAGCLKVVMPGPGGNAYYKQGNKGPFCAEHWADEFVSHAPQLASQNNNMMCSFGARYTDQQIATMEEVIKQIRDIEIPKIAMSGRRPPQLTYSLIQEGFKSRPLLRNEQKCPNCGTVVTWWPDPKATFGNGIPGVVG